VVTLAKKKKPAPINYPAAIAKAHVQQSALEQQRTEAQAAIALAQREIEALQSTNAFRESRLSTLSNAIGEARATIEQQQTYHDLLGSSDLASLAQAREALRVALDEHVTLSDEHNQQSADEQQRLASLQQAIQDEQKRLADLATQIENTGQARLQLVREHGELLFEQQTALLSEAEAYAHGTGREYGDAQFKLGQAQVEALRVLSPWPELRRRFQSEHKVSEDATTRVLAAATAFADLLLEAGLAANEAVAGMPPGALPILQEVDFTDSLQALKNGHTIQLTVQSNRLASLLQQYRRNLAL
jgi:chromosome segregation ATPase